MRKCSVQVFTALGHGGFSMQELIPGRRRPRSVEERRSSDLRCPTWREVIVHGPRMDVELYTCSSEDQ